MTQQITITRPDDWHLHVRDGDALMTVVPHTAAQFGRAIIMPNLRPPVTTAAPDVDVFDREAVFLDTQLIPLRRDFPELRIVVEHITTREAAQYVRDADRFVAATITAHHLLYNRNAIFTGGI